MDKLSIVGLSFNTLIGTHDWEQTTLQTLYADLTLETQASRIAQSDNLANAINYEAIANAVQTFVTSHHFQLIETLAEQLAHFLLSQFHLPWIQLSLHKPSALPTAKDVIITIERART